ncbi:hypothetical protein NP511_09495 [Natrinema thermotolerans]|uniref:Uncharacterized protein n=1 Tax=Natrinema thermotolerans TaxID=121872 RepID=A0AAF0PIF7_9EURY|nr:hypothetical protein [Natrinema thermotolerans]ELZ16367.1 hypothetical protein C478_03075 [Natrinema thermotolerans DSM 11552]QCC58695.1 hypothetical protein DVR14_08675 [Natrinema thermotolerans]WMT09845.1 hypothetical protein NP511_09495 [Natrinema thermotolerans]
MSDGEDSWLASRETTNRLLGFAIVVLAAGFVSVGDIGPAAIRVVAESLLILILVAAIVLFLGWLLRTDGE